MTSAADDLPRARQLTRLRRHRLDRALAVLAEARAESARAGRAVADAEQQVSNRVAALVSARAALSDDPRDAAWHLACIDHADAERATAVEVANAAADRHAACLDVETVQRRSVLAAQGRHHALDTHRASLARIVMRQREEAAAIEQEEPGRRRG